MPEFDFHFLRPWWLLFIPYAFWLHAKLRRADDLRLQWQGVIAPELLRHLTVTGQGRLRLRPYQLMTVMLSLTSIVVAGPTWNREITPFTEDRSPLVIAIELTPSMLGTDQQPTRLARARHKVRDLLKRRRGARTAVIGYAGSAHLLLPFTDDPQLLEVYLEALHPNLMPRVGDSATGALALAEDILANEEVPGSVLFLTDGIDRSHAETFAAFTDRTGDQLMLLAFGGSFGGEIAMEGLDPSLLPKRDRWAPPVDLAGLEAVASAAGGHLFVSSVDDADVEALGRRIRTHLVDAMDADEALDWLDGGYPLVWGVAFCMLFWFRRGWTVQWDS
ncbi:MAG: VWA domain-containing protein [Myxococcota bacterium]